MSAVPKAEKVVGFLSACILLFVTLCLFSIAGMGLFLNCVRDDLDPILEITLYQGESVILNALVLFGCVSLLWGVRRLLGRILLRVPVRAAAGALVLFVLSVGTLWAVNAYQGAFADAAVILNAVDAFEHRDFSHLTQMASQAGYMRNYFIRYPYQLGLAFVYEAVQRVLGEQNAVALKLINVLALAVAYLALIRVARQVFEDKRVTLVTIFLLAAFLQPLLFVTHMYGYFMGLAAALWALSLFLDYIRLDKKRMLLPASILMALAVLVKQNYWIFAVAMILLAFMHLIRSRRLFTLVWIALLVALPSLTCWGVQRFYEQRADTVLGGGMPKSAWLAMGLQESTRAPGWYNDYSYLAWDGETESLPQAKAEIQENIRQRLSYFAEHPAYAAQFFAKKTASQWNEPSFDCIWVSKINQYLSDAPMTPLARSVYYGEAGTLLGIYFRYGIKLIYCLTGAGLALIILRRKREDPVILSALPLIILGGFLYHLLFEAKSQYVLVYVILMLPLAAAGLTAITGLRLAKKARSVPEDPQIPGQAKR